MENSDPKVSSDRIITPLTNSNGADPPERSLSTRQKKILQAFADDFEGREPDIHFGSPQPQQSTPPSSTNANTNTSDPMTKGETHFNSNSSSARSPRPPFVNTEPHPTPFPPQEESGIANSLISGLGKAIGWAERFFGGGGKR